MTALRARTADFEKRYTAEEFQELPEFDRRFELVEGSLVEKPVPGYQHSSIARRLLKAYDRFDPDEEVGLLLQEVSTVLSVRNVPAPDLAFWKAANKPPMTVKAAPKPDLAIEIWSPHDLDTKKRRDEALTRIRKYQAAGVPIIWAINPANKTVEVFHSDQANPFQVLEVGEELTGEDVIPGFKLAVRALFE
jgi:Uma2 family endonuclease